MSLSPKKAIFVLFALPFSAEAQSVSQADCNAIKAGLAKYAQFHKDIAEIRLEIAREETALMVDERREAPTERKVLGNIGERIDGVALDVADILPAIVAYRKICPD